MVVTAKELVRAATRLGFVLDRQKGSHAVYVRGTDRAVIPMHARRTIKPLDDLGITPDPLRDLI